MSNVINIKLSGSLGRRFGVFHKYAVESWPECVRALSSQVEGFKEFMQSEIGSRMKFAIFVDGKNVSIHNENEWQCAKEIRIIPVPTGSKSGGLFQIVLGAVVMATAFFTGGSSLALMSTFAMSSFMMGGAMVLGGVLQMISPQMGGMKLESGSAENRPSYAFGGAVNTTAAGYPLPLPYGYRTVGGAILSAGSYAEDKI